MRTRLLVLLTFAALLVPPATALAQTDSPFDGLPQAPPPPAPTAEPVDDPNDDIVTRDTLYVIGGGLLVTFLVIGWWITRDARRNLPKDERDAARRLRSEGPHRHERQAKAKARAKGRAQRQARKTTRKARR
jgi:hypothetical protein